MNRAAGGKFYRSNCNLPLTDGEVRRAPRFIWPARLLPTYDLLSADVGRLVNVNQPSTDRNPCGVIDFEQERSGAAAPPNTPGMGPISDEGWGRYTTLANALVNRHMARVIPNKEVRGGAGRRELGERAIPWIGNTQ